MFVFQGSKLGLVQPPYPGLVMEFGSPPPAHMGIPPLHSDAKTGDLLYYLYCLHVMVDFLSFPAVLVVNL